VPQRAGELLRLARLLAHDPEHANADKWDQQLSHLVTRHLDNGRDAVLLEAIEQADRAQDAETAGELGFQVEHGAQHQVLGALGDGRGCHARLLAIPVIVPDVRRLLHGHLPENGATESLVASLRQHGLVSSEQCLTLAKYLYHPEELDALAPSEVYRLCQQLALASRNEAPCGRGWPQEQHEQAGPVAGLRFLVGVVAGPAAPCTLLDIHEEDTVEDTSAALDRKMAQWRKAAAQLMQESYLQGRCGQNLALQVYPVDSFFEARRLGETVYKGIGTLSAILGVLKGTGIDPAKAQALVAPYILDDGSVSVIASLYSRLDGSLLGTASYPVSAFELMDDTLNEVQAMLQAQGVGEVQVSDDMVPMQSCDCCGEPMYLAPGGAPEQGILHAATLPPGSLLH
jgi:hypothetical protein